MPTPELTLTPEQLHEAATALVGTVAGIDTVEQAQACLWTWLQTAVGALIADAATYATSPQRGFVTRAFYDAR